MRASRPIPRLDRDFMDRVVTRIVEIDTGLLASHTGGHADYEAARALRATQDEASYARQRAMLKKEERFIERFEKNAAKASQVQSRVKKLDKIDRLEPPKRRVNRVQGKTRMTIVKG